MKELQEHVANSHLRHFGVTSRQDRIRDLLNEVEEILKYRNEENLKEEIGDAGWSLLQLCNEEGLDFEACVRATVEKLDSRPKRKVALIGTSASPITNGHLMLAKEVLAATDCDEVWFYLVGKHPWGKRLMSSDIRRDAAKIATAPYPKMRVCDFELEKGSEIYGKTTETAEILRDFFVPAHPNYEFSWVMGADVLQTFDQWKGHEWMVENMRILVIPRPGYEIEVFKTPLKDSKRHLVLNKVAYSNISSTMVRERLQAGEYKYVAALLPPAVFEFLKNNSLYLY